MFSTLQTRNHPDISILFKGDEINKLSKLIVLCWNSGSEEIRRADVPSGESPSITLSENTRVLSFKLLEQSSPGLNFTVEQAGDRTLVVSFEYLNPKDGGVIEILFEELQAGLVSADLNARIIGGRDSLERRYERGSSLSFILMSLGGSGFLVSFALVMFVSGTVSGIIGGSLELILAGVCIYLGLNRAKLYMTTRVPNFAIKYFEGKS